MKTFASLFTGGGLADLGARAAGLEHAWGVELDAPICVHANAQGFETLLHDVRLIDYAEMGAVDWLHMSPPCTNASTAKHDAGETALDLELGQACVRAIETLRPRRVSLENVWGYRNFEAFQMIYAALVATGYQVGFWHLNAANYGVPQTRKRLIMVASLDGAPVKPEQTHACVSAQDSLFLSPWVGWYAAIEDILDTLPASEFAPWQLERLAHLNIDSLVGGRNNAAFIASSENAGREIPALSADKPMQTVTASFGRRPAQMPRAFLASGADSSHMREAGNMMLRGVEEPATTVTAGHMRHPSRAFIARGDNGNELDRSQPRPEQEPVFTVNGKNLPCAFIAHPPDMRSFPCRGEVEPMFTVTASHGNNWTPRAWLEYGRVVSMTVRALARFQSVPDSYQLPDKNGLGAKIIGNGVPPLLMQRVIEANL